jgi:uncharacterized SAM-binding protein YcdF (DUF218 family)
MLGNFLEHLRPFTSALLLPPVPMLALVAVGAWLALRNKPWKKTAGVLFTVSIVALYLSSTQAFGQWLERQWLQTAGQGRVVPMRPEQALAWKLRPNAAIVVLGGGRMPVQVETGLPDITPHALQRIRYGVWLARQTGLPLAFAGGVSASQAALSPLTEAQVAQGLVQREHALAFRWSEANSRNTRENAQNILPMLAKDGVKDLLLVTHAFHMPRSLRAFDEVAKPLGIAVHAAPTGFALPRSHWTVEWLPSPDGFRETREVWREAVGWMMGR